MHLSDEAFEEFRAIWQDDRPNREGEHPGETVSDEKLWYIATRLLSAVEAVCDPIPPEQNP